MGRNRDINAENVGGHSMIEVRITNWMLEKAKRLAKKDKVKYGTRNTILSMVSDNTRLTGKLGEVVISCYFNTEIRDKREYDIIINQERVEIKSQNINKDMPEPDYLCKVTKPSNKFDRYMFVFVHSSHTKAWIVGTCSKEEFEYKSFYGCPLIKRRKSEDEYYYIQFQPHHYIQIKDLEDIESWLSR
jgi:hypothetical protein